MSDSSALSEYPCVLGREPLANDAYFGARRCSNLGSLSLVVDSHLRQSLADFVEVANLYQAGPQLQRAFDDAYYLVHNSQQIVLKEVGLKRIEGFVQIGRE
jgi:hypothetical protein